MGFRPDASMTTTKQFVYSFTPRVTLDLRKRTTNPYSKLVLAQRHWAAAVVAAVAAAAVSFF